MYKIGIVTSSIERDWACQQLLRAVEDLARGGVVDPMEFELHVNGQSRISIHGQHMDDYDAFIVRGLNRRGEIDYQYEVLELLVGRGTLVINSPSALSIAESKPITTFVLRQAGLPVPYTAVTQDLGEARRLGDELGTYVLKPLYGSYGIGIELVTPESSPDILKSFMAEHGVAYIQEYIPNDGRDIRAFVVGDDIPAAMYRHAQAGQWKTNVYQGGRCQPCTLTPRMREISMEAARVAGLDYTGVDIIEGPGGPVIIELNGAPSWYGLAEATGHDVAVDIVEHVLGNLARGQSARQPAAFDAA